MLLSFEQALSTIRDKLSGARAAPGVETLPLEAAQARVLAEDVLADRDYPPFNRATRDGYAVRSGDLSSLPAVLQCVGEIRAGTHFAGKVAPGQCVQIMTGAPLPNGADAVAMIEHTRPSGSRVEILRAVSPFGNVVRQGSEAGAGNSILCRGRRLGPGEMGLLAAVGKAEVKVFHQPTVAVIPTGDEVVAVEQRPEWFQVRNSNAVTLVAQVRVAGGIPRLLAIARDEEESLQQAIEAGLACDLTILSGGISMGKYDFGKDVLKELGAEIFIAGVAIRPGKPLVFARLRDKFLFGLPGNPVSTFVTFELFVRPAIGMLGGAEFSKPVFLHARLGAPVRQKTGLTMFMPARVEARDKEPVVQLVGWQGSGDLVGVAAANCFLVVHPEQSHLAVGDWVDVLPKVA